MLCHRPNLFGAHQYSGRRQSAILHFDSVAAAAQLLEAETSSIGHVRDDRSRILLEGFQPDAAMVALGRERVAQHAKHPLPGGQHLRAVDPAGDVWFAWSDDHNIYTAESTDHGQSWTCSPAVSTNTAQAIFPWLAAIRVK